MTEFSKAELEEVKSLCWSGRCNLNLAGVVLKEVGIHLDSMGFPTNHVECKPDLGYAFQGFDSGDQQYFDDLASDLKIWKRKQIKQEYNEDDDEWQPILKKPSVTIEHQPTTSKPVKKPRKVKEKEKPLNPEQEILFQKYEFPYPLESLKCPPLKTKDKPVSTNVDKSKTFVCHVCSSRFSKNQHLRCHLIKCHSDHYDCCYCQQSYGLDEAEILRLHMFKHEHKLLPGCPLTCIQCGTQLANQVRYVQHLKKKGPHHNDQCTQCNLTLHSHHEYKIHVQTEHEGKWVYKCGFCEIKFDELLSLKSHHSNHHKIKQEACEGKKEKKDTNMCEECGSHVSCLKTHLQARGPCPAWEFVNKQLLCFEMQTSCQLTSHWKVKRKSIEH